MQDERVRQLMNECLADTHRSKSTITGQLIQKVCTSPFLVWCEAFAPAAERDPESPFLHVLFERGIEHEKNVCSKKFPGAQKIEMASLEDGFNKTLALCFGGANALVQAPLFFLKEDVCGVIDVLARSDAAPSRFGNHHYTIKEIKSAKNLKKEYVMQAAFYNFIIGLIQGYTPPEFTLIDRGMNEVRFRYADFETELTERVAEVRGILKGKKVSPTAKASKWPWESYCRKRAIEENDISIVPNVGPVVKQKLNSAGIYTVEQLANTAATIDIPDAAFKKIQISAKAWLLKSPIVIAKPRLPKTDVELFIDFEGTDEQETAEGMMKFDYLIGLLQIEGSVSQFIPFVSESLTGEKEMVLKFIEYMKGHPDIPLYHYGPYERAHLRDLGKRYGIDVAPILKDMIDVLSVMKRCVVFPTISMSLKEVGRFLGFKWRAMASAQDSIVNYLKFLETKDRKLLQVIIDYNEDDVRATKVVKDYLTDLK